MINYGASPGRLESFELRQVTLRFMSALISQSSPRVLEMFETDVIKCWFAFNLDYGAQAQRFASFTNSIFSAPKRPAIFENLPSEIASLTPQSDKSTTNLLLFAVLENMGRIFHELSITHANDRKKLKETRDTMVKYLSGITTTMTSCCIKLKDNQSRLERYQTFCSTVIGHVMTSCARIIHEKSPQVTLLPALISQQNLV